MEHKDTVDMSDAEARAAIEEYLEERKKAGVVYAAAVSHVSLRNGELVVIYDAALANAEQWAIDAVKPWETLARFVAAPLCDATPAASALRSRIHTIKIGHIDGTSGGNLDVASLCIG